MRVLDEHGLKATFFTEALFACAVGVEPLAEIVDLVQCGGHEVQLHVHTAWLPRIDPPLLPGRAGQHCRSFTEDEQALILGKACDNLRAAGVKNLCAFRAGNYGANFDTLRALARNGIRFDTSHNTTYLDSACGLDTGGPFLQPRWVEGVYELPVTFFEDWPYHYRHAQVCAASSAEMQTALLAAWRAGWSTFVIVSHGFELLRDRKQTERPPTADKVVVKRFEELCRFLGENKDKFRTTFFEDIEPKDVPPPAAPLKSKMRHTAWRVTEQAIRRVVRS
jgi:hypothetical protein